MPQRLRSRYSMVTSSTVPYRVCQAAGVIIEDILAELADGLADGAAYDKELAVKLIEEKLAPMLEAEGASLDF